LPASLPGKGFDDVDAPARAGGYDAVRPPEAE
jgi:hypothetical protein